jgi:photosystem II stability/assembly factor-like uncharacterized protein
MTKNIVVKFTALLLFINVNNAFSQSKKARTRKSVVTESPLPTQTFDNRWANELKFKNIGPSIMSGRVVDVEVNPNNPAEFYAAYATGGLWHTVNNGQSFEPLFYKEAAMTIGDIAVDWKNNIIWIGTGESNSSRSSYAGNGVYKSIDHGKTWQWLGLAQSQHIGKILLDPNNSNIAWVAVIGHLYSPNKERGVYKTEDGGHTWKQQLYIDENTGVIDMDINPNNPNELYACAWYRTRNAWNFVESGNTSGIYKSTDAGVHWKLITTASSGFATGPKTGRIGLAVYAGNPNIIYATVDNQNHRPDTASKKIKEGYKLNNFKDLNKESFAALDDKKLDSFLKENHFDKKYTASSVKKMVNDGTIKPAAIYDYLFNADEALFNTPIIGCEVYRSDNAGSTWKKVNEKGLSLYSTYGYYFGKMAVANDDENKLVICGFDIEMSTDGGKTFTTQDKVSTHPDWHGCWINPHNNKHWVAVNDGGCNVTYDNGEHWFKVTTPAVGQFYNIAVDNAKPYNVYGGLQDNGTWYGPVTTKDSDQWNYERPYAWKNIGGGDGMQVQVDTSDNKTVYSGSQFGSYSRKNTEERSRGLYIHPMPDLGDELYRYNWQTPILLSKLNQDVFYICSDRVHKSLNRGETFETVSPDLTKGKKEGNVPYGTITTICESPLRFGMLYAGTDDGNIQLSKDGGYTWTLVSKKLPSNLYVSRVRASQYKLGRVYATLNGYRSDNFAPYVYMSDDFGETWVQLGKDLPNQPINVILEDNKDEDILYVGTDNGLYASFNRGKSFMDIGQNIPNVPVHDLVIQNRENDLVIGTHGRSIYVTNLAAIQKAFKDAKNKINK